MPKLLSHCALLLMLLLLSDSVWAVEAKQSKSWPLSHFMFEDQALMIKNVSGSYTISFPLSERVEPLSVELDLAITNSNLLHENRAQFVVHVNDYVVGQIKLNPVNNETKAKFIIDKDYLRSGYNQISFKVAQHYTETQCEDWSAPELWTAINPAKSTLTLNYQDRWVSEKLSDLNSLINDKLDQYALSILRADEKRSNDYLYWGALLAQGVQLRLKYVPMQLDEQLVKPYTALDAAGASLANVFKLNPDQLTHDAILVGTKTTLQAILPEAVSKAITGPYLGIFQQPATKARFILVASGNTDQEVTKAVQAFTLLSAPFPDVQQTVIEQTLLPDPNLTFPRQSVLPDHTYQFKQLAFANKVLTAAKTDAELTIRLPADLYGTEEKMVALNLNLAYGAGMRKDSVINISLNGLFNHAIQLKEAEGAHYRNYRITIPLRNFSAGSNNLKFSAVLTPSEYGKCTFVQRENLLVSLYEDSTITFPDVGRGVELPDLQLLERTGFPIIKNGSAADSVVRVLDDSPDSVAAAWHFLAKLAGHSAMPTFDLAISKDAAATKKNIVLIGKLSAQDQTLLAGSPVRLGQLNRFPYLLKEEQQKKDESFWQWLDRMITDRESPSLVTEIKPANAPVSQSGGLGQKFLLLSYPSPQSPESVVLALISDRQNDLNAGVNTLVSPELWSQLKGNIFTWNDQKKFYSQQEGATFLSGHSVSRLGMIQYFSNHPWQWLVLILSLLVLMAFIIHQLLIRYKKRTHQAVDS